MGAIYYIFSFVSLHVKTSAKRAISDDSLFVRFLDDNGDFDLLHSSLLRKGDDEGGVGV